MERVSRYIPWYASQYVGPEIEHHNQSPPPEDSLSEAGQGSSGCNSIPDQPQPVPDSSGHPSPEGILLSRSPLHDSPDSIPVLGQTTSRLQPASLEQSQVVQTQSRGARDLNRWPETDGYPPIMGGSGEDNVPGRTSEAKNNEEEERYFTTRQAAEELGLSVARVNELLASGKLSGEKRKVLERWFISAASVETYKNDPIRRYAPHHRRGRPRKKS